MSKQYGLIDPKKIKSSKSAFNKPAAFESDSDSDTPSLKRAIKAELSDSQKRQASRAQEKALAEDPTIYQYDELYEEMDEKRKEVKTDKSKEERKPKYIEKLLETAEKRKKEQERRIERQVQKEREMEGEMFKDKESFVTSAYRAKLEEMKQAEEQEKREEYMESIGDVTKQCDLGGFYRHIYSQKLGQSNSEVKEEQLSKRKQASDSEQDVNETRSKTKRVPNEEVQSKFDIKTSKLTETLHSRQYRKRQSDEDDNIVGEKNDYSKKIHLHSNLDADSDFSIDSNSSSSDTEAGSESHDDENAKSNEKTSRNCSPQIKPYEKEAKSENQSENNLQDKLQKEVKSRNGTEIAIDAEEAPEKDVKNKQYKIDIWKKRTVGVVFDAALQRYYERKSTRESG